jgi:hypothetical protein
MPTPENRESFIHDRILQDLIAAHLYATTAVADNEEVLELTLSPPDKVGLRTINYKTMKMKEVELIVHS